MINTEQHIIDLSDAHRKLLHGTGFDLTPEGTVHNNYLAWEERWRFGSVEPWVFIVPDNWQLNVYHDTFQVCCVLHEEGGILHFNLFDRANRECVLSYVFDDNTVYRMYLINTNAKGRVSLLQMYLHGKGHGCGWLDPFHRTAKV